VSYAILKIVQFECDQPGCEEFTETFAGIPLRNAEREIAGPEFNWAVIKRGPNRGHYCPDHKPEER
jgi:hypothetical protein